MRGRVLVREFQVEAREAVTESGEANEDGGEVHWRVELIEDNKWSFEKSKFEIPGGGGDKAGRRRR